MASRGYSDLLFDVGFTTFALQAFSGNPIRINFFPSNTSDVMTANCRKVSLVDEVNDNSIVHYIDGVLSRVSGNIYDYLVENENEFSSLIEGKACERHKNSNVSVFSHSRVSKNQNTFQQFSFTRYLSSRMNNQRMCEEFRKI